MLPQFQTPIGSELAQIPLKAWEQALIVTLFTVLLIAFIGIFRRVLNDQRKAQVSSWNDIVCKQQEFMEKQNHEWQNFIREERQIWANQHTQDREQLMQITNSVKDLSTSISAMADRLDRHEDDTSNQNAKLIELLEKSNVNKPTRTKSASARAD